MKIKAVIKAVLMALVILSGAIALPILFRPFFWWHIEPYGIPESMGLTAAQIKQAYGEMLDYCMGLSRDFSVGVLPFSASGAEHFADVRNLFILDLAVFAIAAIALAVLCYVNRKDQLRLAGHTPRLLERRGPGCKFRNCGRPGGH